MATRKVTVRTCDECGREPAEQCAITTPETGKRYVDLCEKHRGVLLDMAERGSPGDRRRIRSYTREEVERLTKQKARQ